MSYKILTVERIVAYEPKKKGLKKNITTLEIKSNVHKIKPEMRKRNS